MSPIHFAPIIEGPNKPSNNEFTLATLVSGIGLSAQELEQLRTMQGYDLYYKGKMRHILPWIYIFRCWSTPMNRAVYLHHIWDYYEEAITSCFIMFEGNEDAENDKVLNADFMSTYVSGKFDNVGRDRELWEIHGRVYDSFEEFWNECRKDPQARTKSYEVTNDFYKLPSGDYIQYDKDNDNIGIRIVREETYKMDMLSKFEREDAYFKELHRYNSIMKSSPKYKL